MNGKFIKNLNFNSSIFFLFERIDAKKKTRNEFGSLQKEPKIKGNYIKQHFKIEFKSSKEKKNTKKS